MRLLCSVRPSYDGTNRVYLKFASDGYTIIARNERETALPPQDALGQLRRDDLVDVSSQRSGAVRLYFMGAGVDDGPCCVFIMRDSQTVLVRSEFG